MMSADMFDSDKQKKIHCPCFTGGFPFHMQDIA
jgi:hypothetical protein